MLRCDGLHTSDEAHHDNLALPNFTLSVKGLYPLGPRDENLGDTDMVTVMWANEPLDPSRPDTVFENVIGV